MKLKKQKPNITNFKAKLIKNRLICTADGTVSEFTAEAPISAGFLHGLDILIDNDLVATTGRTSINEFGLSFGFSGGWPMADFLEFVKLVDAEIAKRCSETKARPRNKIPKISAGVMRQSKKSEKKWQRSKTT